MPDEPQDLMARTLYGRDLGQMIHGCLLGCVCETIMCRIPDINATESKIITTFLARAHMYG